MIRVLTLLGALLITAPAAAHQETVAYSRLVIRENGDVEYALKIPVEDLAETVGKSGHASLNAPEVRGAEQLLFNHFQPLVGMTSGGVPCPVERAGIEVPEDERLYGEMRFVFHCPAGAPVTLDYRVFFDIDPGHMGMLEVEGPGGKARAELISERPRWQIDTSQEGPPQVRYLDGAALLPAARLAPASNAKSIATPPVDRLEGAEEVERALAPEAPDVSKDVEPVKVEEASYGNWWLMASLVVVALAGAFPAMRAAWRRFELRSR